MKGIIRHVSDLADMRGASGYSSILVDTSDLKYRNLLPHALKYGVWALDEGGTLTIRDNGPDSFDSWPHTVPFNLVRQWTFKLLEGYAELVSMDATARELVLRRTRPATPPGWSAGVIFSGADAEIPRLAECLDALLKQPELTEAQGGEIVVCGPERDLAFLAPYPSVRYLVHDTKTKPRLLTADKKNFLAAHLRGPRIAIMHTRICLEPGCLSQVPAEFEITTPRVLVAETQGRADYLSLQVGDNVVPGRVPRLLPDSVRRVGADNYLSLYAAGAPFIDGGVYFARKDVLDACPLHANVAWGEAEDNEWCARAQVNGYLIDMAPKALAISTTSKLRDPGQRSPRTTFLMRSAFRQVTGLRYRLKESLRSFGAR